MDTLRVKLTQDSYDRLLTSLSRNSKALHDPALQALRQKLESSARTEADGVSVRPDILTIVAEELTRIVTKNGDKYGSGGDKLLIIEIAEAFEVASYAPPPPPPPSPPELSPKSRFYEVHVADDEELPILINPEWVNQDSPA